MCVTVAPGILEKLKQQAEKAGISTAFLITKILTTVIEDSKFEVTRYIEEDPTRHKVVIPEGHKSMSFLSKLVGGKKEEKKQSGRKKA